MGSDAELPRARAAAQAAGLPISVLDDVVKIVPDHVPVGPMQLSEGLEFRAVAVIACDDEVLPLQPRIGRRPTRGDLELFLRDLEAR